ncbi:MAG: NapC/NirT family cytochrome c [Planctomycetes bacterium]|nr:NapC/NirT family cytochrome c [Planctomycetota bacterium]
MEPTPKPVGMFLRLHRLLRSNWITSLGAALMTLAVLALVTLFGMHMMGGAWAGPYVGLLTTLVVPAVFLAGLAMVPTGLFLYRKRLAERIAQLSDRPMSLARAVVVLTAVNFAAVGTIGYGGAHYMSSVEFCGKACHSVMEPEYVSFLRSPHQRVDCVKCHVAPGAQGYIEAKLNGTKQLLGVITGDYARPIPTPVHNLVPANQTCEQCHWPEKYLGTKLKVKPHFREDEKVTGYTNVLLMRTGGTRPDGSSEGIHWHVHPDATVEYVATDAARTQIPWLRVVRRDGTQQIYTRPGVPAEPRPAGELRKMDCNDCHNRSAHAFELPGDALDTAFAHGMLPRDIPFLKQRAMAALQASWTRDEAVGGIRNHLLQAYAAAGGIDAVLQPRLEQVAKDLGEIWLRNNWPERKLGWNSYPDLATHAGCFRCHDGEHATPDGKGVVFGPRLTDSGAPVRDGSCNRCHTVLSENEEDPAVLDAFGLKR